MNTKAFTVASTSFAKAQGITSGEREMRTMLHDWTRQIAMTQHVLNLLQIMKELHGDPSNPIFEAAGAELDRLERERLTLGDEEKTQ